MKRPEIWLTIAEAFCTPPKERTYEQKLLTGLGLCTALSKLDVSYHALAEKMNPHPDTNPYWLPAELSGVSRDLGVWNRKHDLIRGTFACLMASLSEKEYKELTN